MPELTIKKTFIAIIAFLEANVDATVSDILDGAKQLASAKTRSTGTGAAATSIRNEDGVVTHVFCYYHKQWEPVKEVPYGAKASSNTKLNSMCKEGVTAWTKQQKTAKNAKAQLLDDVEAGTLQASDITTKREEIDTTAKEINPISSGIGFDNQEDAMEAYDPTATYPVVESDNE